MAGRPHTAAMSASSSSRTQQQGIERQMNEWVFSITSNMTTTVSKWGKEMSRMSSENKGLSKELQSLRSRTARHAAKLAVRDQQNVEDLGDPNRPSKISELYLEFTDGDREDAVQDLNQCFPWKGDNARLVCETFEIAYEVATDAIRNIQGHLLQTLKTPPSVGALQPNQRAGTQKEATGAHLKQPTTSKTHLTTSISDEHLRNIVDSASAYLRKTSDKVDTTAMEVEVLGKLQERSIYANIDYRTEKSSPKPFIPGLCQMAWRLAVQAPSLQIEYREKAFNPKLHEPVSSTIMSGTPQIRYYLWPALLKLDGQNRKVLCKARVECI